ncbi:MAG: helix-turn-helix transcriptional regulator [Nanoarchaeota archaeon]|nr:helix-turn-helix transcriptional regulator [Nanoarchaeota archaeon]
MTCKAYHLFFRNLANPLKTKIIAELKGKPQTVTQLTQSIKEEQSKVSHALMNLRHCSIVTSKQKGKERVYSLNKKTIVPILKIIDKHRKDYCKQECNF